MKQNTAAISSKVGFNGWFVYLAVVCDILSRHSNSWETLLNPFGGKHQMSTSARGGEWRPCKPTTACFLCLLTVQGHDSSWLCMDSQFLRRSSWRPCCLSFLSHSLQMLPLPSWPHGAQPVNPHGPANLVYWAQEWAGGVRGVLKKKKKNGRRGD